MEALVVWFCIVGGTDDQCNTALVAQGFVHEAQCKAYSQLLLAGWKSLNPTLKVIRWTCTASPQYLLYGGKA
jgi:hypothetical protein